MLDLPLLSILTFLPLLSSFFIFLIPTKNEGTARNARAAAFFTTLIELALSLVLYINFDPTKAEFQYVEKHTWLETYHISYYLGVDGLSVCLILLTNITMPLAILSTWNGVRTRVKEYMLAFLILQTLMVGTFCALDLVLFYIFFEAVLIPMYFIIGIWGGERRIYASYKFFLYTLLGSILMLVAILYIYTLTDTTEIPALYDLGFSEHVQKWLWLAFFASFAVKLPMWPVHTWLPDAHVEAPTAGSVILAAILLKMGGYGFIRFSLPLFPQASAYFADFVFILSAIAVIYTSLVALVQKDIKKLIAYSSIAHMGFVTMGIFTFNVQGLQGAIFQMVSHGLVSGALFLCVGVVYERLHTRDIAHYGGLAKKMPLYAVVFMIFTLASIGLPGLSGFVGEILVLLGAFKVQWYWAALLGTGIIFGAAYMLRLYRRMMLGKIVHENLEKILDLDIIEKLCLIPLVILIIFLGIYPQPLLKLTEYAAQQALEPIDMKFLSKNVAELGIRSQ